MHMHYFDWTATSPISQNALDEYVRCALDFPGNPSSVHPLGVEASLHLKGEREKIASLIGAKAQNIFFTSGGTESNSIILASLLKSPTPGEIITTSIEHSAVLEWKKTLESFGWKFTTLPCPKGYLSLETLNKAINEKVRMVCVMKVNNVTGTIQDTKSISRLIREKSLEYGRYIHFHCDAVQALGKIPFRLDEEDIDSAAFSAHKFNGPRGVGILYNRNNAITALSRGGGQETGLRPGTENLAGISSMRRALEDALDYLDIKYDQILGFRCKIEACANKIGLKILSPASSSNKDFSPYIICLSVSPVPSEVFIRVMSDKGFCLSAGSACSSNSKGKAESVLAGMNVEPFDRMSSIRVSLGCATTEDEVELLCKNLEETYKELS